VSVNDFIFSKRLNMSDVDGKELEIDGVPVGTSLYLQHFKVREYGEAYDYAIFHARESLGPRKCWLCGKPEIWHKDYCEDCYRHWIWVPEHGLL
jgi:hypothetical protein